MQKVKGNKERELSHLNKKEMSCLQSQEVLAFPSMVTGALPWRNAGAGVILGCTEGQSCLFQACSPLSLGTPASRSGLKQQQPGSSRKLHLFIGYLHSSGHSWPMAGSCIPFTGQAEQGTSHFCSNTTKSPSCPNPNPLDTPHSALGGLTNL